MRRTEALIRPSLAYNELGDADVIIEAVFEDMTLKRKIFRQLDAIAHRHAFDGDERHDVDGAEPRMLAFVRAEIDVGNGALEERHHRALDAGLIASEREHRSVVRGVGGMIEQAHAGHGRNRVDHARDHVGTTAFADVRNAFDEHRSAV